MINSLNVVGNYVPCTIPVFGSKTENLNLPINNNSSITQTESSRSNLIMQYLQNQAIYNNIFSDYNVSAPIYTPAFDDYTNIKTLDSKGNVVQNIEYKKDGNKLTQEIYVKAVNGSTIKKTIINDGNKKSMNLIILNKNGEITGEESRTYEKLDNNKAISTHNGKIYKISGLLGNVITVEYNGQKKVIDLGKKIQQTLDTVENKPTEKQISKEQTEFLLESVKKLSGDIIMKFDNEIDKLVMLDTDQYEGYYRNENGVRKLKLSQNVKDDMTFMHELGHAINCIDNKSENGDFELMSGDKDFVNTRKIELDKFKTYCKNDEVRKIMNKFTFENWAQKGFRNYAEGQKYAQDEEFAEIIGFVNSMDIDKTNERVPALLQFMPESAEMIYRQNKNFF
ncbi:MAG: hypothetical protein E7Z87_03175 [Cyanobacteria bacterium SIG26]|nr:hypothetical protein [Cyanobacteria bacterium SIG26]